MHRLAGFMRTYWTRGAAGRTTPRSVQLLMLRWWLVALTFKLLGSSWDVSWHFKWLRDDLAPPHIVNTIGTGIAIALVLTHTFTGYGADRLSLRIMQIGTVVFVIAGPIDVINHRINGLDLTAWSPSHMLLYTGTSIMVAGVIRNFYLSYPRDGRFARQWTAGMVAALGIPVRGHVLPEQPAGVRDHRDRLVAPRLPLRGTQPAELRRQPDRPARRRHGDPALRDADSHLGLSGVDGGGVRRRPGVRPDHDRAAMGGDRHHRACTWATGC